MYIDKWQSLRTDRGRVSVSDPCLLDAVWIWSKYINADVDLDPNVSSDVQN
jgi:hypothetical protein